MDMIQKYFKYGLAVLILVGCSEENQENGLIYTSQEEVKITAKINKHDKSSRIVFDEGVTTYANWEIGDVITLFAGEQNNLHYTAIKNEENSEETIQFVSTTDEVLKDLEGQKVYACFPNSNDLLSEISLPTTNVLDYNQNLGKNIYCPFLYGSGIIQEERLDLNFSHLFAYLKLVVNQDALPFNDIDKSVDNVTLSVSEDVDEPLAILSGTFDLTEQTSVYTEVTNEINVRYSYDLSQGELSFYVPVLPQSDDNFRKTMHFSIQRENSDGEKEVLYRMEPTLPYGGIERGHVYIVNFPGVSFNSNYVEGMVSDITQNGATVTAMLTDDFYHTTPHIYKISVMDVSTGQIVDISETDVLDEKTFKCTIDNLTPNSVYIAYMSITYTRNEAMVYDETTMNSITFRTLE